MQTGWHLRIYSMQLSKSSPIQKPPPSVCHFCGHVAAVVADHGFLPNSPSGLIAFATTRDFAPSDVREFQQCSRPIGSAYSFSCTPDVLPKLLAEAYGTGDCVELFLAVETLPADDDIAAVRVVDGDDRLNIGDSILICVSNEEGCYYALGVAERVGIIGEWILIEGPNPDGEIGELQMISTALRKLTRTDRTTDEVIREAGG